MRTLVLSQGFNDRTNSFGVKVGDEIIIANLYLNCYKNDDGIYWGMNAGSTLKSQYTVEEISETNRIRYEEEPVCLGETVLIDGEEYTAKVRQRIVSDQVIFVKMKG